MTSRFLAPVERLTVVPGASWSALAVLVDDDRAIGLVAPGDRDAARLTGAALDGEVEARQIRTETRVLRRSLRAVAVGDAGAGFDRLEVEVWLALDGARDWRALAELLGRLDGPIDRALDAAAEAAVDAVIRDRLASVPAAEAIDAAVGARLAAGLPAVSGPFRIEDLRVLGAGWRDDAASATSRIAELPSEPEPDLDSAVGEAAEPSSADRASETAHHLPLDELLGANPVLLDVWRRETGDETVVAIGGVANGPAGTVLVVHPAADRVVLTGSLLAGLAEALHVQHARVILLPVARTVRELVSSWLAEQAVPDDLAWACVLDDTRSTLRVEFTGPRAGATVRRLAAEGTTDLRALSSIVPWRVVLRAADDDGTVEAGGEA